MNTVCRLVYALVFILIIARALSACDELPASTNQIVDFSAVQAIFNKHCTECHTGSLAPQGLQLTDFRSYSLLVDVPSEEVPSIKRVKPGSATGSYLFQKINCDNPKSGSRMPTTGKITAEEQAVIRDWINQGARTNNEPPSLLSGIIASTLSATPGQRIQFTAPATDADNDPLTYAWDFGDGVTRTGSTVIHSYVASGMFTVAVAVTDGRGGSASASVGITIQPDADTDGDGTPDSADNDDDNDGVPDLIEIALGSSPTDSSSTPFGGAALPPSSPLIIKSLKAKFDFSKDDNDVIAISGTFSTAGESLHDTKAVLVIGNLSRVFQLSANGATPRGTVESFSLKFGKNGGAFKAKYQRGSYAIDLLSEVYFGAANAESSPQSTPVYLLCNGAVFQTNTTLLYSRKSARSGSLTLQKQ